MVDFRCGAGWVPVWKCDMPHTSLSHPEPIGHMPQEFQHYSGYSSTRKMLYILHLDWIFILLYSLIRSTADISFFSLHTANAKRRTGSRASRATQGIDSEVVWSPIFGAERGSEYLPIRLCVVPGLLGEVRF
jgi:hypothetical protein